MLGYKTKLCIRFSLNAPKLDDVLNFPVFMADRLMGMAQAMQRT